MRCGILAVAVVLSGCGGSGLPERCRNLVQDPAWDNRGARWSVPAFAKWDDAAAGPLRALVVRREAEGAIAQTIPKPDALSGLGVIAVGYARVRTDSPLEPTDEDITAKLWSGTVALVNGYVRRLGGFESPHVPLRFTGREVVSGAWKRFVTPLTGTRWASALYPHFAFWGVKLAPGVELQVAAVSLIAAPSEAKEDPEAWVACPDLPSPVPALQSVTRRQWAEDLAPNGDFGDEFRVEPAPARKPGARRIRLIAQYRQGSQPADRFLISVTEDGSDPRLSATSRVQTLLAHSGDHAVEATVEISGNAPQLRIALAAAALTSSGLRVQKALLPEAWQSPRL